MKLRDLKRSRHLGWRDIANKGGIFASFLMVTVLSLYAWSPAKQSSAFDWSSVDGSSPYIASLSGNDEIRISATPSASQAVFDQDDVLELTSTCPYGAVIYLNMDSSESNALSRTGTDEGIKTISATTGTALNDNSWGYSLDDGSTYLPMPLSTGTPVNIYNSEQVESNTEITVKYGMKIDSSIPSGYYSGNVLYSIVTNPSCARYTLSFDTDGGTPIEDVLLTYGQTIDLPDYTTTKDNYVFDGWELIGSVSTTYDGTETDVDVNPGNALTVELKAKWIAVPSDDMFTVTNMQDLTWQLCEATTTPYATATDLDWDGSHRGDKNYVPRTILTDTRDGNRYLVSKLADGNCWMSQNLGLDLATNKTLTNENTDLVTIMSFTPENNTQTGGGVDWKLKEDVARSYHPQGTMAYMQGGKTAAGSPTNTGDEYLWEKNGNYYNWYAATAGTGKTTVTSKTLYDSICPKGWMLPGSAGKSYRDLLYVAYEIPYSNTGFSQKITSTPFNFLYSGEFYYDTDAFRLYGNYGYYIVPIANTNASYPNNLKLAADSYSDTDSTFTKGDGLPIRCVQGEKYKIYLRNEDGSQVINNTDYLVTSHGHKLQLPNPTKTGMVFAGWFTEGGQQIESYTSNWSQDLILYAHWNETAPTMQSFNCESLHNIGATIILRDDRNYSDNLYTIQKLADGNCWMTENLRIGKDSAMILTSEDSDIAEDFELPAVSISDFNNTYDSNGVYYAHYTWYTATAGEGTQALSSGNTEHSICPRGWRLPTGGEDSDFQRILSGDPLGFSISSFKTPIAGTISNGALTNNSSSNGANNYWSSTAKSETQSYVLSYSKSTGRINNSYSGKYFGYPIRCVAR